MDPELTHIAPDILALIISQYNTVAHRAIFFLRIVFIFK
jgi:hypothetical protein